MILLCLALSTKSSSCKHTFDEADEDTADELCDRPVTIYSSKGGAVKSTRFPPMWPGFESCRRHMWVEFVVGSLPCSERFFSGFPLSLKTNTFKFQFDLERTDTFQRVLMNFLVIRG